MKTIILYTILFTCFTTTVLAQVAINTDASSPDNSAMLDVKSTTKGLLVPRMTRAQRNAIASPANGLMIYQTDNSPGLYYNSGTSGSPIWVITGAGSAWGLSGNALTNPAANFIGTTDIQPLRFRVNNLWAGEIHPENFNVFIGVGAGNAVTTGQANTAIGEHALFAITDGNFNAADGYYALSSNTSGYSNTGQGTYALNSNTTGHSNTALGRNALYANTTGNFNTASGESSILTNTTGGYNTANGVQSLYSNNGSFNNAFGYQALYFNTSGSYNTANGSQALYNNTGGIGNTANGYTALYNNLNGLYNTATGASALFYNTEGIYNTASGNEALRQNTSGSYNTANGNTALYNNSIGNNNTALGNSALHDNSAGSYNTGIGGSALLTNQGGSYNTAIGYLSLSTNFNGSNNTAIGYAANASTLVSNATAIGNGAIVNVSNKVRLGNTAVTIIEGQVAYSFPSDARFKYNIKVNVPGLDFINRLTPVTYYFDDQQFGEFTKTGIINNSVESHAATNGEIHLHTGFLAQDVEEIANTLGYEFDGIHAPVNDRDHYSLAYSQFIMPLVKAVQEQQAMIEELRYQNAELIKRVGKLENK